MTLAKQLEFAPLYTCACCGVRGSTPCDEDCDRQDDDERDDGLEDTCDLL